MEKNKIVLRFYINMFIAAGLVLLVNGAYYIYRFFNTYETETIYLVFSMVIGIVEIMLGLLAVLEGFRSFQLVINKKEKNDQTVSDVVLPPTNKKRPFTPKNLFNIIHKFCLTTIVIFVLTKFNEAFVNDQLQKLYTVYIYFFIFFLVLIPEGIITTLKKKNKLTGIRFEILQELVIILGGSYCLIINIINYFDITTLVVMSELLALELIRFIYLIVCLSRVEPEVKAIDDKEEKQISMYKRFVKEDNEDKDDYSI